MRAFSHFNSEVRFQQRETQPPSSLSLDSVESGVWIRKLLIRELLIALRFPAGLGGSALHLRIAPRARPVQHPFTRMLDLWWRDFRHMGPRAIGGDGPVYSRAVSGTCDWTDGRCRGCRKIEVAMGFFSELVFLTAPFKLLASSI